MSAHYVVPSAEGERASFGLPQAKRDEMLRKLTEDLRVELKLLQKK